MKPVYGFYFVDTIYSHFSDEVLANIAKDLLYAFKSANFNDLNVSYSPIDKLFSSMNHVGDTCVKARPGDVSIDFTKTATQGWVGNQIYDAETLIEEILYRAKKNRVLFNHDVDVALQLGDEIAEFIDKICVFRALSARELIDNSRQVCSDLNI